MSRQLKTLWPESKVLSTCLILVAAIVALMPLHPFLSTWGGTTIGPLLVWKSWKEIVLALVLLIVLAWVLRSSERRRDIFSDKLILVILAYTLLTFAAATLTISVNGVDATLAALAMNLRYLAIFGTTYVVFRSTNIDYTKWQNLILKWLLVVGAVLATIGIIQVTLLPNDFLSQFGYDKETTIAPFVLIDQNSGAPRAFATLRGPNDYGAFLLIPLILSIVLMIRQRWLPAATLLIGVGILASGSRSAWLGIIVAVATVVLLNKDTKVLQSKKLLLGLGSVIVLLVGLLFAAMQNNALRLVVFHSSPGDSSLTEGSTDNHWSATADGIGRVVKSPLGCGPGCAGPASYYGDSPQISENYYVQIAEEVGIIGLGLWLVIIGIIARRLYELRDDILPLVLLASLAGLSVIGLWLHVWSDDPLALTWWALAGVAIGVMSRSGQTRQKSV